jgi:hypothetical protein
MQSVNKNGSFGPVEEFNEKKLQAYLDDIDVDHVDVFPGTAENIAERSKLEGKTKLRLGVKKRFQKAPTSQKTNRGTKPLLSKKVLDSLNDKNAEA